jgi:N,N'-diacetyllegionaminate synthase
MELSNPDAIWRKISSPVENGVFIIAEAGKNFIDSEEEKSVEEYLENAKELVDEAALAGADAIKFQTHCREDEILNIQFDSPHAKGIDRYEWVGRNERATPLETFWKPLKEHCDKKGIVFMSTPFSRTAAEKLIEVGVKVWKIGSADILDFVCMDYLRNSGLPILISSGMSTLDEVECALNFLLEKNKRVSLMHCLSKYPGTPEEANLATMELFREKFPNVPIGFSENSLSIDTSTIAVAMGARSVERHFTLNRGLWGADQHICSEPREFKELVVRIRAMEKSPEEREKWLKKYDIDVVRGKKEKLLQDDEKLLRPMWRKSLMAGDDISAGTVITKEMLYAMRPFDKAGGLPSERYEDVLGKKINKNLKKYDPITEDILV